MLKTETTDLLIKITTLLNSDYLTENQKQLIENILRGITLSFHDKLIDTIQPLPVKKEVLSQTVWNNEDLQNFQKWIDICLPLQVFTKFPLGTKLTIAQIEKELRKTHPMLFAKLTTRKVMNQIRTPIDICGKKGLYSTNQQFVLKRNKLPGDKKRNAIDPLCYWIEKRDK